MKPLGPYVAARDLPGRMNSPVRTLRATDRLTGMPVLLHALPTPQALPALPEHPNVLRPSDCVVIGAEAFMVTELPLQARPAQDPELTARGALAALAALHERGAAHGGLSGSQLWSVDGEVRLAGAGLPWGGEPRPQDDLYALAVILHEMGGIPDVLRPLLDAPGRLDARAALRLLPAPTRAGAAPGTDAVGSAPPAAAPTSATSFPAPVTAGADPVPPVPVPPVASGEPERRRRGSRSRLPGLSPAPQVPSSPAVTIQAVPEADDPALATASPASRAPAPLEAPAAADGPDGSPALRESQLPHDGTLIVLGEPDSAAPQEAGPELLAAASASGRTGPISASRTDPELPSADVLTSGPAPDVPLPTGKRSPQERRRLEHEARREQAARDAQAAAERRLRRLGSERPAPVAPAPIQIGFDDDLPTWAADPPPASPQIQVREVPRLPESLRRAPLSAATGADLGSEGTTAAAPDDLPGTLPARRRVGEPIRIGWDEDDSWRVVREAPSAPVRPRRPLPLRLLFWAGLGVGFTLLALLLADLLRRPTVQAADASMAALSRPGGPASSVPAGTAQVGSVTTGAATLQPVQFTVRGVAGATARLSVEQAPKGAHLAPGTSLGTAPGRVRFPVAGTYRVRVAVDGFSPGSMTVTVPRTQPVTIDLDN